GFSLFPLNNYNLPREDEWAWNQSSAKATARLDSVTTTFYKLNVRKRRSCLIPPSYKIWIFDLEGNKYFLWCEKGISSSRSFRIDASPKSSKIPPTYSME